MPREINPHYLAVIFCTRCKSNRVDVSSNARFRCSSCGHEAVVDGFTIGRVTGDKAVPGLTEAVKDVTVPFESGVWANGAR